MQNTREVGVGAEQKAKDFLINNEYKILDINFLCSLGEIDIIAEKCSYIIFIEVKSRENLKFGYPIESITKAKVNKIKKIAQYYILKNKLFDRNIRFDAIVLLRGNIEHFENIIE